MNNLNTLMEAFKVLTLCLQNGFLIHRTGSSGNELISRIDERSIYHRWC